MPIRIIYGDRNCVNNSLVPNISNSWSLTMISRSEWECKKFIRLDELNEQIAVLDSIINSFDEDTDFLTIDQYEAERLELITEYNNLDELTYQDLLAEHAYQTWKDSRND